MIDVGVWIISDVCFVPAHGKWMANTDIASQSSTDPNAYVAAKEVLSDQAWKEQNQVVEIEIGSGTRNCTLLGTYICKLNDHLCTYYYDAGGTDP